MTLLNIFKGKKGKIEKHSENKNKRKAEGAFNLPKKDVKRTVVGVEKLNVKDVKKLDKKDISAKKSSSKEVTPSQVGAKRKRDIKVASSVLEFPRITEKSSFLQQNDQYVFRVFSTATKPEIKKAIEEVYGVDVLAVRTINVKRKSKRLGRSSGFQKGYKKAIIKMKKGQSIEVMPK